MKKTIYLSFLMTAFILLSIPAFAGYRIILKNGSEFIVDNYTEEGGQIKFYKMGGEIRIDKSYIGEIKKTTGTEKMPAASSEARPSTPSEEPAVASKGDERRSSLENSVKEITKRKEDLQAEKEKLDEEKKKLEEDFKNRGRLMYPHEVKDFEKRSSELEEKINKFNDEADKLNREQQNLLRELKSPEAQQPQQ